MKESESKSGIMYVRTLHCTSAPSRSQGWWFTYWPGQSRRPL